ncbi:MAG: hypothetical protein CR967_03515 [Proteobacteria bacterium]|nr:MAG: hypothetical protein CR967_03515 [Pseudomonadota bacterium]
MFEQVQSVNSLMGKVEDLLAKYENLRDQNEKMRQELVSVKAQNEAKDSQILKLQKEIQSRDLENEDIFGKIEAVLGK